LNRARQGAVRAAIVVGRRRSGSCVARSMTRVAMPIDAVRHWRDASHSATTGVWVVVRSMQLSMRSSV
jgi:hypothetical protein